MKPRYYLLAMAALCIGLICGDKVGSKRQRTHDSARIWRLEKKLERFEDPAVFHHAEYVARLTRASLYQVLTGRLDGGRQNKGEYHD